MSNDEKIANSIKKFNKLDCTSNSVKLLSIRGLSRFVGGYF